MKNLDEKNLPQDDTSEQNIENRILLVEGSENAIIREEDSTEEISETLFAEEADSDFTPEEVATASEDTATTNDAKSKKKDKKKKAKKDKKKKAKNKKKKDKKKKNDKKAKKDKKKKKHSIWRKKHLNNELKKTPA